MHIYLCNQFVTVASPGMHARCYVMHAEVTLALDIHDFSLASQSMLFYLILCQVKSYYIIPYYIISCHIISCYVILCYVILCQVISYCVKSYHIISCINTLIMSYYMSYYMLFYMSYYMSFYIISYYINYMTSHLINLTVSFNSFRTVF